MPSLLRAWGPWPFIRPLGDRQASTLVHSSPAAPGSEAEGQPEPWAPGLASAWASLPLSFICLPQELCQASPGNQVYFGALSLGSPSRGLWVQMGSGVRAPTVWVQASPSLAQAQPSGEARARHEQGQPCPVRAPCRPLALLGLLLAPPELVPLPRSLLLCLALLLRGRRQLLQLPLHQRPVMRVAEAQALGRDPRGLRGAHRAIWTPTQSGFLLPLSDPCRALGSSQKCGLLLLIFLFLFPSHAMICPAQIWNGSGWRRELSKPTGKSGRGQRPPRYMTHTVTAPSG